MCGSHGWDHRDPEGSARAGFSRELSLSSSDWISVYLLIVKHLRSFGGVVVTEETFRGEDRKGGEPFARGVATNSSA